MFMCKQAGRLKKCVNQVPTTTVLACATVGASPAALTLTVLGGLLKVSTLPSAALHSTKAGTAAKQVSHRIVNRC
jgi:hypothetical protein